MKRKNKKKLLTASVSTAILTTTFVPVTATTTLTDIGSYRYAAEIQFLVGQGIIMGYKDGTFKPNRTVSRSDIVRLLGRYLVSLGYEIPSDYRTNIAFTDLSAQTDNELLQYAALVKKYGVFYGDGLRLMPHQTLTREQAAMVLVRAFSTIDQFDYAAHVAQKLFVKEYLDVEQMTDSARQAIDVFDYYNIVTDTLFYPMNGTTRGQFAGMMYAMMQLRQENSVSDASLAQVTVVSPLRLKVTLADFSTHDVLLQEPLIENVPTSVKFSIDGQMYTPTVIYRIEPLKVLKIEQLNGGQFVVHFNQEVDLVTTYREEDLEKVFSLTSKGWSNRVQFQKGELSEDKKSFKVTIDSSAPLEGEYQIKIASIYAVNGSAMPQHEQFVYFTKDMTIPQVASIEPIDRNKVKVKFTEPIQTYGHTFTYTNAEGKEVSNIDVTYEEDTWNYWSNSTELIFDLEDARADYSQIKSNEKVYVKMKDVFDLAGNKTSLSFAIQKGGADGKAPKLLNIEPIGAKSFKMTFNEPMEKLYAHQVLLESNQFDYYVENVERVAGDDASFIVTVNDYLDGMINISSNSRYLVHDISGQSGTFSMKYSFGYDASNVSIERTEVARENNIQYLYVYFNRNIELSPQSKVNIQGTYDLNEATYPIDNTKAASIYEIDGQRNAVRIVVDELLMNNDRDGAKYNLQLMFDGVKSEYNEPIMNSFVTFKRMKDYQYTDDSLQIVAAHTSRTNKEMTNNSLIVLEFNYPVDEVTARNLSNYELDGYTINSAIVSSTSPNKVELIIAGTIANPDEPYLFVKNVRGKNVIQAMETYYERIYLNESESPTYRSAEFTGKREVTMTFSEAIGPIDAKAFYAVNSKGDSLNAFAVNDPTDSRNVILTFSRDVAKYSDVTIRLLNGRQYKDVYQNAGSLFPISLTNNEY